MGRGKGMINEKNIVCERQNNPELVIEDCRKEFGLSEKQCDKLRFILLKRGINKWLYARRKFIKLKHEVKELLKGETIKSEKWKLLQYINMQMQNIAKTPRWIEFPKTTTHNWRNIEKEIVIKGKHM